tara:strand:- start:133014 stop:133835 length:822 start_codon:yes stop_codon:yes gene_type:complete
MSNFQAKVFSRFAEKVADSNLPPRSDMFLVDMREIDAMKCNALIAYEPGMGSVPTLGQLERYVEATFNGRVHAQSNTASVHEGSNAVSVMLTLHHDSRPVTDAVNMRRITASSYMDDQTGHLWQVVSNDTNKFMIRRTNENISDIVAAKLDRRGRKSASFDKVRQAAPLLSSGDTVRFFDGVLPQVGKITSMNGDDVSISSGGKSHTVPRESVFNIVERSESKVSDEKSILRDYWERAVGNSSFADKLTRKLNQQAESPADDSGWTGTTGTSE